MELDLRSLFGLHVHSCTETPQPPPPLHPHLGSYTRALLVSQERPELLVTPCRYPTFKNAFLSSYLLRDMALEKFEKETEEMSQTKDKAWIRIRIRIEENILDPDPDPHCGYNMYTVTFLLTHNRGQIIAELVNFFKLLLFTLHHKN
jgi:hypothetical protein